MAILMSVFLKATIVLLVAALLARAARGAAAAVRHLIWSVSLGAIVALGLCTAVLPAWRAIPVPAGRRAQVIAGAFTTAPMWTVRAGTPVRLVELATGAGVMAPAAITPAAAPIEGEAAPTVAATSVAASPMRSGSMRGLWQTQLPALWFTGALLVAARSTWQRWRLSRLVRLAVPAMHLTPLAKTLAMELHLSSPALVLESGQIDVPLACGAFRARVLVPPDSRAWPLERAERVLRHELAHVERRDALTQLVADAASALFWCHPLVWHAVGQMRLERERACDDQVLRAGAAASSYASDLLTFVVPARVPERHPAALAMARRSQFEGRLVALLDPSVRRGRVPAAAIGAAAFFLLAGLPPLAALTVAAIPTSAATQAPVSIPTSAAAPTPATAVMPATAPGAAPAPTAVPRLSTPPNAVTVAPPPRSAPPPSSAPHPSSVAPPGQHESRASAEGILAGCVTTGPIHESNHSDSDDVRTFWNASARHGDCSYDMKSQGKIVFNRDVTGIDGIAADGFADITATIHGTVTKLSVRPGEKGGGPQAASAPVFSFSRDGSSVPFLPDGAGWLAKFLVTLDRQTAFAIDRRLPALIAAGGPARVLDEISEMFSTHTRATYLTQLIQRDSLASPELRLTYIRLASTLGDDHDRGDALVALARRVFPLEGAVRQAYLDSANALEGRYERNRVLEAMVRSGR